MYIDSTKTVTGGIENLSFMQIIIGLVIIAILILIIYYATKGEINIFKAILKHLNIFDENTKESKKNTFLEGNFKYKCCHKKINNIQHEHGGFCKLETTSKEKGLFIWKLNGKRTWRQDGEKKINFDENSFIPWHSTHAIIFSDNTFMFRYEISIEGRIRPGFAQGSIVTNNFNGKHLISELNGMYFQYDGNEIVEGHLKVTKIYE